MSALINILNVELAPRVTRHGVFIEVYSERHPDAGRQRRGQSETAVEAGETRPSPGSRRRGRAAAHFQPHHRGHSPGNIRHFIELRGIGIVNVARIYGIGAVKVSEKVDLVVEPGTLGQKAKNYSRTGLERRHHDILGVSIPSTVIPVMPGRNLAVIIETRRH